jgi:flagellin
MSFVINTNLAATFAANNLAVSNAMLQRSLNRLSSGSRIIVASDDAAGLAVSMKLSAAANRSAAAQTNLADTTSYLQQQDSNLSTTQKVLNRISELKTLYGDPTKNSTDLAGYNTEFQSLQQQLASLTTGTFNGISLFGSSGSGVVESVKASEDGTQAVTITAKDLASSSSGVGSLADSSGSGSLASISLSTITTAINNVGTLRANNGAEQSRLGFASEILTTNTENLRSAYSQINDVDVAQESANLARWNLLVQSGVAMLTQANQNAQIALKLIG